MMMMMMMGGPSGSECRWWLWLKTCFWFVGGYVRGLGGWGWKGEELNEEEQVREGWVL